MAWPSLRCQACRVSVLDAFTSLVGISVPPRQQLTFRTTAALRKSRSLYTSSPRFQDTETQRPAENEQLNTINDATSSTESDALPWYLTLNEPLPPLPTAPSSLLARQEIPILPSSPPPILDPLLNHLSTSIGLDNLTLLDLRTLHPPPALGANLLMIIGTARSVKHLNVSADRFCRWLRTTYKLRPYADGLLGRNELKIKLRRKARRLKLARTAGRLDADEAGRDDGITTGWVCVNVGPVDDVVVPETVSLNTLSSPKSTTTNNNPLNQSAAEQEGDESVDEEQEEDEYQNPDVDVETEADADADEGYTGFGSRTTSQRIVVQIFTEEKRAEMNLEDLYMNRTTRMQKRETKVDEEIAAREAREAEAAREIKAKASIQREKEMELSEESHKTALDKANEDTGARRAKQEEEQWAPFFKNIS